MMAERTAHRSGPVRVRVIESASELGSLADDWERLSAEAIATSVFQTYDWLSLWWQTYGGGGRSLRLLVASAGSEVVGILPLYVQTEAIARLPVRVLRFVGKGGDTSPDDLGPVLAAGREAEVAAALADAVLALPGWDVAQLTDMLADNAFAKGMERAAQRAGLTCFTGRSERVAFITLPATWDAFLQGLHSDRRYRIRRMRKKLLAEHTTARFFVWSDPATLDQGVDRLIHLHQKRWRATGEHHAFSTPEYVGFHRAVMHACTAKDRLRLYALEIGGEIAAMFYFYKFRDTIYLFQTGFDPDFAKLKPGLVLLGFIIEHAIGQRVQVLDFLRGAHRYKDELANGERETVYLTALRARPGAWAWRIRRMILPGVKAQVMKALDRARRKPAGTPELRAE